MGIHVKSGYADKYFVSEGKRKKELKKGKWKEYQFSDLTYYRWKDGRISFTSEPLLTYATGSYINDKREGLWKIYFIDHKTKKKFHSIDANYKNGGWEGLVTFYYPDGNKASTLNYTNNKGEGQSTVFYPNGSIERKLNYTNGDAQGPCKTYYPSGKLKSTFNYCDNMPCGLATGYFETGEKKYEESYANGHLQDTLTKWYKSGAIEEVVVYNKGELTGIYQYYYESGQLWVERVYKDGLMLEINALNDPDGNPLDYGTLSNGNGKVNYYTLDGKVYLVKTITEGKVIEEVKY
jgi:antitoxin component YwqK of YwqJK toxin-antitoxin module